MLALDVDTDRGGERSLVGLERRHGWMPETFIQQWTGSGHGRWQAFFEFPAGRQIGNSAGKLGPGLDVRGIGGYALLSPSRTRQRYGWAPDRGPFSPPLESAPDWLLDRLDQVPAPQPGPRQSWTGQGRAPADYLVRAIEAELALVASAPETTRNTQLNESAFDLFRFAAEGRIRADALADSLQAAARHAGLEQPEILASIRSAATSRGVHLR